MKKNELIFTAIVLLTIGLFGYFNMQKAQVLARDIQRKNDLKHVQAALTNYLKDVGKYPPSEDGKMVACIKDEKFIPCDWGKSKLESTTSAYLQPIPEDPLAPSGKYKYVYISNTQNFQIYTALERQEEDSEYNKTVVQRNLMCGKYVCNFGVSSGVPLDQELPMFKKVE